MITLENGDEIRRGVARDIGEMWAGWPTDRPAMIATCWPKFAWKVIMCKTLDRTEHPAETCSCKNFNVPPNEPRPSDMHHHWCPYHPIRESAKL